MRGADIITGSKNCRLFIKIQVGFSGETAGCVGLFFVHVVAENIASLPAGRNV